MIIALHGAKGSGKDEFYRLVQTIFPDLYVRKVAYADPIKDEICNIFDLQTEYQYDQFKRSDVTYQLPGYITHVIPGRHVVREIGMLMRSYDESQFVKYVERRIKIDDDAVWFITDCRFQNEVDSVKQMGGIIVKIKRDVASYDGHVTETEIADTDCDFVIENNGTIEEFSDRIATFLNLILESE